MPTPTSWPMLIDEVMTIANERPCKTLVIDTLDWAERMCAWDLCQAKGWNGIEDAGYGKGYTYLAERFGQLLNSFRRRSAGWYQRCSNRSCQDLQV